MGQHDRAGMYGGHPAVGYYGRRLIWLDIRRILHYRLVANPEAAHPDRLAEIREMAPSKIAANTHRRAAPLMHILCLLLLEIFKDKFQDQS